MQVGVPLRPNDRDDFIKFLNRINCCKKCICEGMIRSMDFSSSSGEVAEIISNSLLTIIKDASFHHPVDLKIVFAHLFLISDILFNT